MLRAIVRSHWQFRRPLAAVARPSQGRFCRRAELSVSRGRFRYISAWLIHSEDGRNAETNLPVPASRMTQSLKAQVLFSILKIALVTPSERRFKQYADDGDVEGLWTYYQNAMKARPDVKKMVERGGKVTFEMLLPAMKAVFDHVKTSG